jgi:hypothetical protein
MLPVLLALAVAASSSDAEAPPLTAGATADAPPSDGSRFGMVALAGGTGGPQNSGMIGGLGVRAGLRQRDASPLMFMPALAVLGGATYGTGGLQPWAEARLELMAARHGGTLLPAVHGFLSTGFTVARVDQPTFRPPLGGRPDPVRPYLGVGGGWNWLPFKNEQSASRFAWSGGVVLMALLPVIFAGRVELRVTPGLKPGESAELALVGGVGF